MVRDADARGGSGERIEAARAHQDARESSGQGRGASPSLDTHNGRHEGAQPAAGAPAQGDAPHHDRLREGPTPACPSKRAPGQLSTSSTAHTQRLSPVESAPRTNAQGDDPHYGRPSQNDG